MTALNETIQRVHPRMLAQRFGCSVRWWETRIPRMREAGVISRRGRFHFARLRDVETWLEGNDS